MKPSFYETPENDAFTTLMNGTDDAVHFVTLNLLSRNLEQRLMCCRHALRVVRKSLEQNVRPDIIIEDIDKTLSISSKL